MNPVTWEQRLEVLQMQRDVVLIAAIALSLLFVALIVVAWRTTDGGDVIDANFGVVIGMFLSGIVGISMWGGVVFVILQIAECRIGMKYNSLPGTNTHLRGEVTVKPAPQ